MATPVRELITAWGFQIDQKPIDELNKGISDMKSNLKAVAAVAIATGAGLFGIAKSTADAGDNAAKTAKQIGVEVAALQELRFAAEIGGASQAELDTGLRKLSRTILEARRGTETYARVFRELGVETDVVNNENLKADDILGVIADKFKDMPAGIKKTALAQELFGRAGTKLIPTLNEGSEGIAKLRMEANELGIVMGDKLLADSEEFQDAMLRVQSVIAGLRNIMGAELIPIINDLLGQFKDFVLANKEIIKTGLLEFVDTAVVLFKDMFSILSTAISIMKPIVALFGGLTNIIKFLTTALSIFLGAKFLIALGALAIGLKAVAVNFTLAGNSAAIAQAKLLLVPLAIGAIIAAIALIVEDFVAFTQGRDSVFGRLLGAINEIFGSLQEKFGAFGSIIQGVISAALTPVRILFTALRGIVSLIDVVRGKASLGDTIKGIGAGLLGAANPLGGTGSFSEAIGLSGVGQGSAQPGITSPNAGANNTNNQNLNVNNNLEVNVTGMPPEQAQEAVQSAVENTMGQMLRETSRSAAPQAER